MVNHQLIRNACKEVQNNLATLPMGCTLTPSIMSNLPNDLIIDIVKIALDAKCVEVDKETHRNKLINVHEDLLDEHLVNFYWDYKDGPGLYTQYDEDDDELLTDWIEEWLDARNGRF